MRVLFIGDIVGRPGRTALAKSLPGLRREYRPAFVIANAENAAGGMGITRDTAAELLEAGVDVLTTGNHIWKHREAASLASEEPRLLRPANYPSAAPGRGAGVFTAAGGESVGVVNLLGRTFMRPVDCPFLAADREIGALRGKASVVVVDMHAEATSEKQAMGWYLDGRVSAVVGTHTHVQTADERILPWGTAYLTDVGMTGPRDSILGVEVKPIIARFLSGMPARFRVAGGPVMLGAAVIDIEPETGRATSIVRVLQLVEEQGDPDRREPEAS